MDPPLISEGSFSTLIPSLAEIWPFNGGAGGPAGMLGMRMGSSGGAFEVGLMDGFVERSVSTVNRDGSMDESTVTDQSGSHRVPGGGRRRIDAFSEDESSKLVSTTTARGANELMSISGSKEQHKSSSKTGDESSSSGDGKPCSEKNNQPNEPPKDYIHVRARRGQATDSHSLAERARRKKISERMKVLQDLVPGCNKVIGKALVLDEIINYIQSLQRQVEFLSMKLEVVTSGLNPAVDGISSKDVVHLGPITFDAMGTIYGSQGAREFATEPHPDWLHIHLELQWLFMGAALVSFTAAPTCRCKKRH